LSRPFENRAAMVGCRDRADRGQELRCRAPSTSQAIPVGPAPMALFTMRRSPMNETVPAFTQRWRREDRRFGCADARYGDFVWGADGKGRQLERLSFRISRRNQCLHLPSRPLARPSMQWMSGPVSRRAGGLSGEIVLGELIKKLCGSRRSMPAQSGACSSFSRARATDRRAEATTAPARLRSRCARRGSVTGGASRNRAPNRDPEASTRDP